MSASSVNTYSLSDSLERDLAQANQNVNRAYAVIDGLGIVFKAIGRGAAGFGRYLVLVAEALNEARARDARFSGSQW